MAEEVGKWKVVEKLGCWSKKFEFLKQGETWKDFKPRIFLASLKPTHNLNPPSWRIFFLIYFIEVSLTYNVVLFLLYSKIVQ